MSSPRWRPANAARSVPESFSGCLLTPGTAEEVTDATSQEVVSETDGRDGTERQLGEGAAGCGIEVCEDRIHLCALSSSFVGVHRSAGRRTVGDIGVLHFYQRKRCPCCAGDEIAIRY